MLSYRGPIRILQVVGGMNRGGVETWLMHVLRHIDRERFRMDFLVHTTEPTAYDDEIRALGSQIIPCLHPSQPWRYMRNLERVIRQHGPYDIVHGHLYLFNGVTLRVACKAGVKGRIAHIHTSADIEKPNRWRAFYQWLTTRWISRYASLIVAVSGNSLKSFGKLCDCHRQPSTVLHYGIDLTPFNAEISSSAVRQAWSLPINKPVITYVARFAPLKNHAQLVRIADHLNQAGYRFHFVMAGSHGELMPHFSEIVRNRQDISILAGVEIPKLLLASDLFLFPSLLEGLPVAALEACAAGVPVVGTDLPAMRDACPPSYHPFLFPPHDDATACAHILTILQDAHLRTQLSAAGKRWAEGFSIEKSVAGLRSIYESCLE